MRLYSYTMTADTGFAPNPFGGYCTLAACTPNRMAINAEQGDWLIGIGCVKYGNRLIYAMEIAEILHFDDYFRDERFQFKKPQSGRGWRDRCGDNIYFLDDRSIWQQRAIAFHNTPAFLQRDTKNPYVFIGRQFYYFGHNAVDVRNQFPWLARSCRGCRCNHSPSDVDRFLKWLRASYDPGIHGDPIDTSASSCVEPPKSPGSCGDHRQRVNIPPNKTKCR